MSILLSHFKSVDQGFCCLFKSLVMATLGGEESAGVMTHNNEIWVLTEKMNHFGIRE